MNEGFLITWFFSFFITGKLIKEMNGGYFIIIPDPFQMKDFNSNQNSLGNKRLSLFSH